MYYMCCFSIWLIKYTKVHIKGLRSQTFDRRDQRLFRYFLPYLMTPRSQATREHYEYGTGTRAQIGRAHV